MYEHLSCLCCDYGGLVDFRLKEIIDPDEDFGDKRLNAEQLFAIRYHLKKGLETIERERKEKGGLLEYLKDGIECGCGTVFLIEDKSYALSEIGL